MINPKRSKLEVYTGLLVLLFLCVPSLSFAKNLFSEPVTETRTSEPIFFNLLHKTNFVGAAEHGEYLTVKEYLDLGMNPNATDHNKHTALMGATLNGHNRIVKLLISKGASVNLKNNYDLTAIDYARIQERVEMVPFLENHSPLIIRGLSSTGK